MTSADTAPSAAGSCRLPATGPAGARVAAAVAAALPIAYAAALAAYVFSRHYLYGNDDAFITYRYAWNLAHGHGLVFNPGERVWGFTSPLHALLLAVAAGAGLPLPEATFCLSLAWGSLTTWVVYRLCLSAGFGSLASLLACLVTLTSGWALDFLGMETSLLVLLQTSFLLALLSGRCLQAGLLGSLSCLARPDSVLLVIPGLLLDRQCRRWRPLLVFALPGLAWTVFAYLYYGAIVPNTLQARMGRSPFWGCLAEGGAWFTSSSLWTGLGALLPRAPLAAKAWGAGGHLCLALLGAAPLLDRRFRRRTALAYSLCVYPWLLLFAYALLRGFNYRWEVYSAFFFHRLSVLVGIWLLWRAARLPERLSGRLPPAAGRAALAAGAVLAAALLLANFRAAFVKLDEHQTATWLGGRTAAYREVADWMNRNLPAGADVGVLEIGVLGYYTSLHLVDTCGLIEKGYHPKNVYDVDSFLERFQPSYLLFSGRVFGLHKPGSPEYRLLKAFPARTYEDLSLLKRVDPDPEARPAPVR